MHLNTSVSFYSFLNEVNFRLSLEHVDSSALKYHTQLFGFGSLRITNDNYYHRVKQQLYMLFFV